MFKSFLAYMIKKYIKRVPVFSAVRVTRENLLSVTYEFGLFHPYEVLPNQWVVSYIGGDDILVKEGDYLIYDGYSDLSTLSVAEFNQEFEPIED